MNPQDTKLQRILELAKIADALTPAQAKQFVELLVNLTNKQKEELIAKSNEFADTVSQETHRKLNEAIGIISEKHKDAMLEVRQLTNKQKDAYNAKMSELEGVIAELKAIEIRDGIDAEPVDKEEIVKEVLAKIPTPKEVVLDNADQIVAKINTTTGKIEAKTIRGLVETIDNISKSNIGNIPRIAPSILEVLSNGTNVQQGATRLNFLGGATYNNGTIEIPAGGGTITGSGTSGQVTYWNGTSSITGDNNYFWDNTNKRLGIGTTSPLVSLDVVGAIRASTSLTATAGNLQLTDAYKVNWTGGSSFIEAAASYMRFATNGAEAMRITSTGNVGIGTTTLSSSTRLDIKGTDVGSTKALIVRNSAGTDNFSISNNGHLNIQGSVNIATMTSPNVFIRMRDNATGFMTIQAEPSYGLLINPNAGNVGIGTTTPGAALHVNGSVILQTGSGTQVSARGLNANYFSTSQTLSLYAGTAGDVVLGPGSNVVTIKSTGNVGIANNTPFTGLSGMLGVDIGVFNTAGAEGNLMVRGFASLGGLARGGYGGVGSNYYLDTSGTVRRRFNDTVSVLGFASGGFQFFTSGSGAVASNITFTELARLNTNGNFLLGTTTDSGFKLDVVGTFRSSGSATIGGNIALTGGAKINFATGGGFIEGADTYLRFATNAGTERARINNAGNFGIGTASPLSTLHVSDTSGAGIYVERVATPSTTSGGAVTILNNGSAPISGQRLGGLYMGDTTLGAGGSASIQGFADGTFSAGVIPGSLRFYTTGASGATLNERMRINSLGNVLIGTTTDISSAILNISSTTKGLLLPRMTTTEVNAIASPVNGLLVYNTTIDHFCGYQAGAWVKFSHSPM